MIMRLGMDTMSRANKTDEYRIGSNDKKRKVNKV